MEACFPFEPRGAQPLFQVANERFIGWAQTADHTQLETRHLASGSNGNEGIDERIKPCFAAPARKVSKYRLRGFVWIAGLFETIQVQPVINFPSLPFGKSQ